MYRGCCREGVPGGLQHLLEMRRDQVLIEVILGSPHFDGHKGIRISFGLEQVVAHAARLSAGGLDERLERYLQTLALALLGGDDGNDIEIRHRNSSLSSNGRNSQRHARAVAAQTILVKP